MRCAGDYAGRSTDLENVCARAVRPNRTQSAREHNEKRWRVGVWLLCACIVKFCCVKIKMPRTSHHRPSPLATLLSRDEEARRTHARAEEEGDLQRPGAAAAAAMMRTRRKRAAVAWAVVHEWRKARNAHARAPLGE